MRNMIHGKQEVLQLPSWKIEISHSIRSPIDLVNALSLPLSLLPSIEAAHKEFPIRVPPGYLAKIEKNNIHDPLLMQVLAIDEELKPTEGYDEDPVGDQAAEKTPGLLHKYYGRALLTVTGACGIHCRYCFRRHFDYAASNPAKSHWQKNIQYLNDDPSIFEIILSGGDPLSLDNNKLAKIINDLETIPHLKILRIHSRQPIVAPSRIDQELIQLLTDTRFKCVLVLHCNHPAEIDELTENYVKQLKLANIDVLNQSVLLKGINNTVETLEALSHTLFMAGIQPYYLHTLDKVSGAAHFDVPESEAITLHEKLQKRLPGYLTPRLVREIEGKPYKTSVR